MCLIMSADSDQYSGIWNNPNNSTVLGTYNYPKTRTAAYDVLYHYKKLAPTGQVHALPAAVTLVKSGNIEKIKTVLGNYGIPDIDSKKQEIMR